MFLCILFNSGCFLNTFYAALDGLDFLNFGLKPFWEGKLLSEWKFDRNSLVFRKTSACELTCRHPQALLGTCTLKKGRISWANTTLKATTLNTEGTCLSRILIFRDKTFNSGKFWYRVLQPHLEMESPRSSFRNSA